MQGIERRDFAYMFAVVVAAFAVGCGGIVEGSSGAPGGQLSCGDGGARLGQVTLRGHDGISVTVRVVLDAGCGH